jgi:hypothetical protein
MVVAVVLVGIAAVVGVVEVAVLVDDLTLAGGRVALVLILAFDFGISFVVIIGDL